MKLTDRDREIVRQVHQFRVMTTEQICHLLFSPSTQSICRKRLKLLYHNGYLDRLPAPSRAGVGLMAVKIAYRLSRKGAEELAGVQRLPLSEFWYWGKHDDKHHIGMTDVGFVYLNHTLAINDVRIAIIKAVQSHDYQIETWIDDTSLKSQEMKDYVTIERARGGSVSKAVIPDAYFKLLTPHKYHFFIEYDHGTESLKTWREKIRAYEAYWESGKYQKRYHTNSLRVLVITPSAVRCTNLKTATEKETTKTLFLFSTFPQVVLANPFSDPMWLQANKKGQGLRPLIFPDAV